MLYLSLKDGENVNIGERIRKFRVEKGLSQKELGERMNVSQQMIGQYENSSSFPKIETLKKIAAALEIDTIELLNFEDVFEENDATTGHLDWDSDKISKVYMKENEKHIIKLYRKLNDKGRDKVIEYTDMLTNFPEYRKDTKNK